MSNSYPTKAVVIIDVPEPNSVTGEFVYNFFVPNEKVNDSGLAVNTAVVSDFRDSLEEKTPRAIKISFNPVTIKVNDTDLNRVLQNVNQKDLDFTLLRENLKSIQSETEISPKGFSSLNLQDENNNTRYSRALQNALLFRDLQKVYKKSPADRARSLGDRSKVPQKFIFKAISGVNDGVLYKNTTTKKVGKKTRFSEFDNIKLHTTICTKRLGSIVRKGAADSTSDFSSGFSDVLSKAISDQEKSRQVDKHRQIDAEEFIPRIFPISSKEVENNSAIKPSVRIVGYVVDKFEILPNRKMVRHEPVIITNQNVGSTFDSKIKYGATYSYAVRAIALVKYKANDSGTGKDYIIESLISSKTSNEITVKCEEFTPPPPPGDLRFYFQQNKLTITWDEPVVGTKDVKKFQIFRRSSVKEAFELLAEYDFDDSEIKTSPKEVIEPRLIKKMRVADNSFKDEEFNRDSQYIYAVCCVDAHGFSSGYSQQFLVSYDKQFRRLKKEIISQSGSPKPYPNFYLNGETSNISVDAMKVSGFNAVDIYFDPEYLLVENNDGEDLNLLAKINDGGKYTFQFVNTDRQQVKNVDIKINELNPKRRKRNRFE